MSSCCNPICTCSIARLTGDFSTLPSPVKSRAAERVNCLRSYVEDLLIEPSPLCAATCPIFSHSLRYFLALFRVHKRSPPPLFDPFHAGSSRTLHLLQRGNDFV